MGFMVSIYGEKKVTSAKSIDLSLENMDWDAFFNIINFWF